MRYYLCHHTVSARAFVVSEHDVLIVIHFEALESVVFAQHFVAGHAGRHRIILAKIWHLLVEHQRSESP